MPPRTRGAAASLVDRGKGVPTILALRFCNKVPNCRPVPSFDVVRREEGYLVDNVSFYMGR